jgi:D-alanine-D-alanine ligase
MNNTIINKVINKITVLYGGDSAEREVSLSSGKAIAEGLITAGYDVSLIDTKGFDLSELAKDKIDLVFIALHGRGGEDGSLQGALEYMNIPYTGSNVLGSALSMDKVRSKQIMQSIGLPTADFFVVNKNQYQCDQASEILNSLGGKVMVKPANEGSSIGMAMAANMKQLNDALVAAFNYDEQVLIEAWIDGPEYTVGILGNRALPVIHMETPHQFYDYKAKYQSNSTQYYCPSGLNDEEERHLQSLSIDAFNATGASCWGRVDIMRNGKGEWQILEVNTVPGMTNTSLVPKAAKALGLSFTELVTEIVNLALTKNAFRKINQ